jgi:hypothetical protein
MGTLQEARNRLQETTAKREAVEKSLQDITNETRQLRSTIQTTVDTEALIAAQARLQALDAAYNRLEPQLRYSKELEKMDTDNVATLELRKFHAINEVADCEKIIATLEAPVARLQAISTELQQMQALLTGKYIGQLRKNIIGLGGDIVVDYQRAVRSKADSEDFLRRAGE